MTVKEIFDLRRQGRIEEAYDAIRPMYAAHKGRYTTLCMFWTATDIFKKRLDEDRLDEADKILQALQRMLSRVEEITRQLDSERTSAPRPDGKAEIAGLASSTTVIPVRKYPWEHDEPRQNTTSASSESAAAAFLLSAELRLKNAKETSKKKKDVDPGNGPVDKGAIGEIPSPMGTTVPSRGHAPTDYGPIPYSEPCRNDTKEPQAAESPGDDALSLVHHEEVSTSPILDTNSDDRLAPLNAMQRVVLACVVGHPGYSVPRISESTGIPQKSIERHVSALIDRGLIELRKGELWYAHEHLGNKNNEAT